jgi:hypothetical protein
MRQIYLLSASCVFVLSVASCGNTTTRVWDQTLRRPCYGIATHSSVRVVYTPEEARVLEAKIHKDVASDLVGLGYAYGEGSTKPDWKKSMDWYLKAAMKDSPEAQKELGLRYYLGIRGAQKDWQEADFWLKAVGANECWIINYLAQIEKTLDLSQRRAIQDRLKEYGWANRVREPIIWN